MSVIYAKQLKQSLEKLKEKLILMKVSTKFLVITK
jgi:hypothetical protein